METVNVLWTGGLDSSYRIIELSRLDIDIQPYYIYDHTRGSIKHELKAIKMITDDVKIKQVHKSKAITFKNHLRQ